MPKQTQLAARPPIKTPNQREIGDSGLMISGIINGNEYNPQLKGPKRIQQYDEMRQGDAHVRGSLKVVKLPILSANWRIQAGGESRFDKQVAEFIDDAIFVQPTRTWQETLTNILLYLDYGVMPFEKVYKFREDGKITLKKLAVRHPRTISRWELKDGGNGIEQTTVNGVYEIPMAKMVVFVNEKEGDNWEGNSILRSAWKHWKFKDRAELIEVMAMEKHGLGVPMGSTPPGATPEDEAKLDEILKNMRANENGFVRKPTDFTVEMMDMKSGSVKNPNEFIKRQEWAIMLNVLATFMQLGSGSSGSWSLARNNNAFFIMALEYVAKHIAQTFNKYVIKDLVDMNFETDVYPELVYDKIGDTDVNMLTTALQRAIQTGVLTVDSNLEIWLREVMDLPEFTGETLIDPAMADDMLAELDNEVAGLDGSGDSEEAEPEEDPENPGFDMDGNPLEEVPEEEVEAAYKAWDDKTKKAEFVKMFGGEVWETMKTITAGARGVPLSDETKKKISEALKKGKGKAGAAKKGKGKKKADPAIKQKQAEIKKIKEEARQFNTQVRRELLEMRAKGQKLSPEEQAKKQLDVFNRKEAISTKISKLQGEIDEIKSKSETKAPEKKAHSHQPLPPSDDFIKVFEAVESELNTLKTA